MRTQATTEGNMKKKQRIESLTSKLLAMHGAKVLERNIRKVSYGPMNTAGGVRWYGTLSIKHGRCTMVTKTFSSELDLLRWANRVLDCDIKDVWKIAGASGIDS